MTWTEEQQRRYEEALAEYDNPPAPPSSSRRVRGTNRRVRLARLDAEGNPTGEMVNIEALLQRAEFPRIDWQHMNEELNRAGEAMNQSFRQVSTNLNIPALSVEAMRTLTGGSSASAGTHSGLDELRPRQVGEPTMRDVERYRQEIEGGFIE